MAEGLLLSTFRFFFNKVLFEHNHAFGYCIGL